jgi:hemin uptake protein HemP
MSTANTGDAAHAQTPAGDRGPRAPTALSVSSANLFGGHREVVILHRGQEYRLRITKADKLILTK